MDNDFLPDVYVETPSNVKTKTVALILTRWYLLHVLDTFKMARKGKLIHVCTVKMKMIGRA